jgi:hypothetical protein
MSKSHDVRCCTSWIHEQLLILLASLTDPFSAVVCDDIDYSNIRYAPALDGRDDFNQIGSHDEVLNHRQNHVMLTNDATSWAIRSLEHQAWPSLITLPSIQAAHPDLPSHSAQRNGVFHINDIDQDQLYPVYINQSTFSHYDLHSSYSLPVSFLSYSGTLPAANSAIPVEIEQLTNFNVSNIHALLPYSLVEFDPDIQVHPVESFPHPPILASALSWSGRYGNQCIGTAYDKQGKMAYPCNGTSWFDLHRLRTLADQNSKIIQRFLC